MGYYVEIVETEFVLPAKNFEEAYQRMCKLNDNDELKSGGSYGRDLPEQTTKYNPNKWFSWMPYNYPETCNNVIDIFNALGFEDLEYNENGDLINFHYSNKIGSEGLFLSVLGGLMEDGSYIIWQGEERGHVYKFSYTKDECIQEIAEISYNWKR